MTQITYCEGDAAQAVTDFLTEEERFGGVRPMRRIVAGTDLDGDLLGVILDAADYRRLRDDSDSWNASHLPHLDDDLPAGYRPWTHGPEGFDENGPFETVNDHVEPLLDLVARMRFQKSFAELEEDTERLAVRGLAVTVLAHATLPRDSKGAVPVLCYSHTPGDNPQPATDWRIMYATSVHGLFVHASTHAFFNETWSLHTGCGLVIKSGYFTREAAEEVAATIGQVLPDVPWMRVDNSGLPAHAVEALRGILAGTITLKTGAKS